MKPKQHNKGAESSMHMAPKIMAVIVLLITVAAFIGMVTGFVATIHFWIIMILSAAMAFIVIPRLKKAVDKRSDTDEKEEEK